MWIEELSYSDHLPTVLQINTGYEAIKSSYNNEILTRKFIWTKENVEMLKHNLSDIEVGNETDINTKTVNFTKQIYTAMESANIIKFAKRRHQLSKPWYNKDCYIMKKTTKVSLQRCRNSNNTHDRQKYIEARREYLKLLQRKRDEFNKDKNEMIKNAKDPKSFWNAIAAFRKKPIIQGEIDIKEWFLFYKNLLNKENNEATFTLNQMIGWKDPDLDAEITLEEIYDVVKKLANGKAVGLDGIPNELLKNLPTPTLTKLKNLFNKIMSTEKYPQLWTNSIVHPIYKSGDRNNPTNYRGIALCSNISKLFTTILRNRLNNWIEKREIILENQAGFRKNRSCTDHILLLNSLIQLSLRRKRGKLYVFFVDLTKAFDTVPHDLLWQKLHKMGISNKFVMLIKNFYQEAKITIRWKGQYSSNVKINSGVLQGESLSPLLFILYMADLIELYNNSALTGFHLPDFGVLHLLMYADDIAIIGESKINLQTKINLLKSYLDNNKLVLNENKSKVMVFRNGGRPARHENWLNYDDIQIELPNILKIKIEQLLQQDLAKLSLTKTYSNYRLLYDSFIPEHYFSCNLSSALVSFIAQIRIISTLIKENHIYVIKKEDLYCKLCGGQITDEIYHFTAECGDLEALPCRPLKDPLRTTTHVDLLSTGSISRPNHCQDGEFSSTSLHLVSPLKVLTEYRQSWSRQSGKLGNVNTKNEDTVALRKFRAQIKVELGAKDGEIEDFLLTTWWMRRTLKFKVGDFGLEDQDGRGRWLTFKNEDLKSHIESNYIQTVRKCNCVFVFCVDIPKLSTLPRPRLPVLCENCKRSYKVQRVTGKLPILTVPLGQHSKRESTLHHHKVSRQDSTRGYQTSPHYRSEKKRRWRNKPTIPTKRPSNLSPKNRFYGRNTAPRDFRRPANSSPTPGASCLTNPNDTAEIPARHETEQRCDPNPVSSITTDCYSAVYRGSHGGCCEVHLTRNSATVPFIHSWTELKEVVPFSLYIGTRTITLKDITVTFIEERESRLANLRERFSVSHASETEQQREVRLKATRERPTTSRASKTDQQREARLKATRKRATTSRASETEQQREARLKAKRERATTSRASETAEQRGDRLSGLRDRATTSRASDHLFIKISLLRHKVWSGTFHKNDIHGDNLKL
ncbi:hypothetical protein LAZ67_3005053 [Cordylochernes scorpioides]|uniref:Reverse transcriptase domain-containing protein n=1 Tax=Cordylochernes scorpioides TaxID=51811 RepID=A0ABY6KB15_9ARAC|nr:hypothetical protein LAZ67_3005053 [Cordylochernes scorpioides]